MNQYLKEMKDALTTAYQEAKRHASDVATARETYLPDAAAREISRLDSAHEQAQRAARDSILAARDRGIASAKAWGKLDGSKITDDAKLLKLDLSSEEFEDLVERYKHNATMLHMLAQYAETHRKGEPGQIGETWYPLSWIPTVESKVAAYSRMADSAIATLNAMNGSGWGRGVDSPIVAASVEQFGQPDPLTEELLYVLD